MDAEFHPPIASSLNLNSRIWRTPMEPLNTTVRFDGDKAEAWAGSQFQTFDQIAIAQVLGLKPEQVTFHTEMAGGGFGRRAVADSHVQREAAEIAKRFRGTPIKLVWTREEDVQGGYYRPMHVHRVEIGIGEGGMPSAWRHVIVGQSILAGTPFAAMMVKNGIDNTAIEGAADTNIQSFQPSRLRSRSQAQRAGVVVALGGSYAHGVCHGDADRRAGHARRMSIRLNIAASCSSPRLPSCAERWIYWRRRAHRGAPVCRPATRLAFPATNVSEPPSPALWMCRSRIRRPRIHRATIAVDCGLAVNPSAIESQFQAGIGFGLTQLMAGGAITLKDGQVEQRNFDRYTPPYIMDAPLATDVHIVPSTEPPPAAANPRCR
jgi:isoquinoline 1-oxidoreductase beta subunit